jgi:predicted dienelactone hydrolase
MVRRALGILLAILPCACSDESDPSGPTAEELMAAGPYAVGFREAELAYPAPAATGTRTLPLRIWYPAVAAGEGPAEYSVAGIVAIPSGHALAEPALAAGGPFPLAIYSHGSGGEGLIAYPYGEHLASHGWVVIAPNHTGNTARDGIMMTSDPFGRIALDRPLDISAILDWLEDGADGDAIAGVAATERTFLFGHSFGGYTTFAGGGVDLDMTALEARCEEDECDDPALREAIAAGFGDSRIVAIASQAPALVPYFVEGELGKLAVPTMLMSGRRDQTTTNEVQAQPAWDGLDHPDDLWIEAPDGGHLSFITVCDDIEEDLLVLFQPNYEEDGCGPTFTPVAELVPAFAAYLLGFARRHVLGETQWTDVLTGPAFHPALVVTPADVPPPR